MRIADRETIESMVTDDTFWQHYNILKVPGDGHCLLYSVLHSIQSQHSRYLTKSDHIADECENRRVSQQRDCFDYKVYKSCFGDILLCVLTQALGIDLLILNKANSGYFCNFISNSDDSMCTLPLLILVRNELMTP